MLYAGFAEIDATPVGPVPLAGYFTWNDRLSDGVRDPLKVRALALGDGRATTVLVVYDLLFIIPGIAEPLRASLKDTGAEMVIHATHTHSAPGGIWDDFAGRRALGAPRPEMAPFLIERGERAVRAAIADMLPARAASGSNRIPHLAISRRHPNGPRDDELTCLKIARKNDEIRLVCFASHPVIVAERQPTTVSADFPGEVVKGLEQNGRFHGLFVQGALGGVDVLFPEGAMTADENLRLVADPIIEAAGKTFETLNPVEARPVYAEAEFKVPPLDVRPFFDDQTLARKLDAPLRLFFNFVFRHARNETHVMRGLALGDFALAGTPADLGVNTALGMKQAARAAGFAHPVAASQCEAYLGYVHRRRDYFDTPPKKTRYMATYENVMGFFGRDMGERFIETSVRLFDRLARGR